MNTRLFAAGVLMLCFAAASAAGAKPRPAARSAPPENQGGGAVLINTCLITNDVRGMSAFYARVLQVEPHREGDSYAEFRTGTGVLALFAADAQEKYIPGSAVAGKNRSSILEFRVTDPDNEYARLKDVVKWVKGPTTQPWGTRSIYFRDPDGNLVDFFAPAKKQ